MERVSPRGFVAERIVYSSTLDPYLSVKALADYSGLSVRTLRSYVMERVPERALPVYPAAGQKAIRASTADLYRSAVRYWRFGHTVTGGRRLGAVAVDQVTREQLGAVLAGMRSAGKSRSLIGQVHHPVKAYYRALVETKALAVSPAADLKFFVGKRQRKGKAAPPFFTREEGPMLLAAAKEVFPRWQPFMLTGLVAGLRWGESAALFKTDADFKRGYIHVQRTISRDRTIQRPKDRNDRHVKMSPAPAKVLQAHFEAMDLEGQVNDWSPEQRRLAFPMPDGKPATYAVFFQHCIPIDYRLNSKRSVLADDLSRLLQGTLNE